MKLEATLTTACIQQQMTGPEDIRESTFDWNIDKFMEKIAEVKKSPRFRCSFGDASLFIPEKIKNSLYKDGMFFVHCTINRTLETATFLSSTFYKLCLVDRHGQECLTLKGTALKASISPLCFSSPYLQQNSEALLPKGTLTIRLSLYKEDERGTQTTSDLSPGSSSSSIDERGTQTETLSTRDNYSNTEKEPTTLLETLSKDFGCFYDSKTDTDCVLRVGDTQFPVHRQVLVARSEVFAAMFRHDTSENRSGVVDIPDVDAAVLGNVLYYIYSGHIRGLSTDTTVPMYTVADKYALIELRDICLDFLMHNLTMENVCSAAILSHSNGEIGLEEKVVQFIQAELNELVETENWKQFLSTKSVLASRLLCSALMASREEIKKLTTK